MTTPSELHFRLDRAAFFQIGLALHRGFGAKILGDVTLKVQNNSLLIESQCGGGEIPCEGQGPIHALVTAKSFCTLVTQRSRGTDLPPTLVIVFRPKLRQVAIDRAVLKRAFQRIRKAVYVLREHWGVGDECVHAGDPATISKPLRTAAGCDLITGSIISESAHEGQRLTGEVTRLIAALKGETKRTDFPHPTADLFG